MTGTTVSAVTENNGVYTATLTGSSPGSATVTANANGTAENTGTVTLTRTAAQNLAGATAGTATAPASVPADGTSTTTTTVPITGADGQPLKDTAVTVKVNGTDQTVTTDSNGKATLTLPASTTPGDKSIPVVFNGSSQNVPVTYTPTQAQLAASVDASKSAFTTSPASIPADNSTTTTLSFTPKDSSGNPVKGLNNVTFAVSGVTGTTVSAVTENNGVYTATLKGSSAGSATV
ncbi:Ig-like domain-containing protein, partial [Buttiauxella gaviniae]|uniref:Ig-like domain-containing protein n=1 Tax=Buttiauxella gaviniae TaxID=82990 RepID=UPI001ADF4F94